MPGKPLLLSPAAERGRDGGVNPSSKPRARALQNWTAASRNSRGLRKQSSRAVPSRRNELRTKFLHHGRKENNILLHSSSGLCAIIPGFAAIAPYGFTAPSPAPSSPSSPPH